MKTYLFAILFAVSALPIVAAEPVNETKTAKTETRLEAVQADALSFILEKSKQYSGKVEDTLGKAVDVAREEAPETIRQFLVWRAWKHLIYGTLPLLLIIGSLIAIIIAARKDAFGNEFNGASAIALMSIIVGGFGGLLFMVDGFSNLLSFIQIQVAPRIYLIEEVAKLIK